MEVGDVVWFVDGGCKYGKPYYYAEYGTIKTIVEEDYFIIGSYFGDFGIAKDRLFKTKEECEEFIKGESK